MKFLILAAALCAAASAISSGGDSRIVNGDTPVSNALMGQFPYQAAVRHSGTLICGGSLIGPRWVLTSGECVWHYQTTVSAYSVYLGGLSIVGTAAANPGRIEIGVTAVYPHPAFRTRDTLYDSNVGLIHLSFPAPIGPNIQIAIMAKSGTVVPAGQNGELAGWGGTNAYSEARVSPTLQWAQMTTISVTSCTSAVGGSASFGAGHICTYAHPGPSACWYDHGGALVDKTRDGTIILGVVAYAGCLDPTHPTIYTSIGYSAHRTWITTVTGIPDL